MKNESKYLIDDLPDCPECDENLHVQSLGVIKYGADYSDGEWYEKCQFLSGYYCHDCDIEFVIDDDN